jgi:ketosteroid isomerase-like protein
MAATTPEQIHRVFEDRFNAGDLDGLMELYEPDAAPDRPAGQRRPRE